MLMTVRVSPNHAQASYLSRHVLFYCLKKRHPYYPLLFEKRHHAILLFEKRHHRVPLFTIASVFFFLVLEGGHLKHHDRETKSGHG